MPLTPPAGSWKADDPARETVQRIQESGGRQIRRPVDRVEADLRARVSAGEWAPGQQLPSTAELAHHYRVSRSSVNRAVSKLADEGLLVVVAR